MSPQRVQEGLLRRGNSVQQRSQIGADAKCGSGEPQREQKSGRRAQPRASTGLRRTRATARQREVSKGGTSNVSEPESLRKTHLTCRQLGQILAAMAKVYALRERVSSAFTEFFNAVRCAAPPETGFCEAKKHCQAACGLWNFANYRGVGADKLACMCLCGQHFLVRIGGTLGKRASDVALLPWATSNFPFKSSVAPPANLVASPVNSPTSRFARSNTSSICCADHSWFIHS